MSLSVSRDCPCYNVVENNLTAKDSTDIAIKILRIATVALFALASLAFLGIGIAAIVMGALTANPTSVAAGIGSIGVSMVCVSFALYRARVDFNLYF